MLALLREKRLGKIFSIARRRGEEKHALLLPRKSKHGISLIPRCREVSRVHIRNEYLSKQILGDVQVRNQN